MQTQALCPRGPALLRRWCQRRPGSGVGIGAGTGGDTAVLDMAEAGNIEVDIAVDIAGGTVVKYTAVGDTALDIAVEGTALDIVAGVVLVRDTHHSSPSSLAVGSSGRLGEDSLQAVEVDCRWTQVAVLAGQQGDHHHHPKPLSFPHLRH